MSEAPAFQFYPGDFLADENQMVMELAEAGAYIRLLCVAWIEGSIPTDIRKLAKICGTNRAEMEQLWPAIALCFERHPREDGRLVSPRLEREREKQAAWREKSAKGGKKGAAARAAKAASEPPVNHPSKNSNHPSDEKGESEPSPTVVEPPLPENPTTLEPDPNHPWENGQPKGNSSVFSLQSPSLTATPTARQHRARDGVKGSEALARWLGPADNGALDRFIAAHPHNAVAVDSIRATYTGSSLVSDRAWGKLAEGDRPPTLEAALEAWASEGRKFQANVFAAFVRDRATPMERRNGHTAAAGRSAGAARAGPSATVAGPRKTRHDFK